MNPLQEFWWAVSSYKQAFSFLKAHQLQKWIWLPGSINLALFAGIVAFGIAQIGHFSDGLILTFGLTDTTSWWQEAIAWLIPWLVGAMFVLLLFKLYKHLMLILLSPILPQVAEKVQVALSGKPAPPFQMQRFVSDLIRGITLALRNLFFELAFTLPLYALQLLLPVIAPFLLPLIIAIESYYLGFGMIDLHLEFHRYSAKESKRYMQQHKGFVLGNGLVLWAWLLIPLFGVITGPTIGVVAAGLGREKLERV